MLTKDCVSTKEERLYSVYIKAAADLQGHTRIKAMIGEEGGENSIYLNKSISKTGFSVAYHRLFAAICGTIGELIKDMNFNGESRHYYSVAATKKEILKNSIEDSNCKNYPVDVYIVQASNREELLNNEEIKKIYAIPEYTDDAGNFKGVIYGIGEFHEGDVTAAGLLNKVYHATVNRGAYPDFLLYGNEIPKPSFYSNDYEKAVIKILNEDFLSHYGVYVTDTPKEF